MYNEVCSVMRSREHSPRIFIAAAAAGEFLIGEALLQLPSAWPEVLSRILAERRTAYV